MTHTVMAISTQTDSSHNDEQALWMPPRRMLQYQLVKAGGAILFIGLFTGWFILQGANPAMRWATAILATMTTWIATKSIYTDIKRARGRQISLKDQTLAIRTPKTQCEIAIKQIDHAQWREDDDQTLGLWFFDKQNKVLAHLDQYLINNQMEARAFLCWARQRATLPFDVQWTYSPTNHSSPTGGDNRDRPK